MFWKQVQPPRQNFVVETKGHRLQYLHGSDTLVVSFDNAADAKGTPYEGRPIWGQSFYRSEGHSLLGVSAATNDWFRCGELIAALTDLAESGFFKNFRHVVMAGSSMGGFAAAAFAPLAPGCTVLSLSPQATLDPEQVPWEKRFADGLRQDWSLPFGNAAEGLKAARVGYVLYDPLNRPDQRHVNMIAAAPSARFIKVPAGGHGVPPMLVQTRLMKQVSRDIIAGRFDEASFYKSIRVRKDTIRYYRMLAREALLRRKFGFALKACEFGLRKFPESDLLETKALALCGQNKIILALQTMDDARNRILRSKK
ncbi:MAG: hypothetical protein ACU0DH_03745 [Paracoccus sp. (in: a-proteobacteria)]|uniref:hypothetical protein n=1 Tax=Paracoccaceae TaxID=31989 RepID=UPI0040595FDB